MGTHDPKRKSGTQDDPIGNYTFHVNGITSGHFSHVEGLSYEVEMIEYRVSDDPMLPRYRPGTAKYGRLTLKKGYIVNKEFNQWMSQVQQGTYERKNGTIELRDNKNQMVASWNLFRCLPTKWSINGLDGKGNEVVYESIELVVEEIRQA